MQSALTIKHLHDSNNSQNNNKNGKSGNHPEIRSNDSHKVLENQKFKI